jgi:type IX secretion system substrate protein
MKQKSTSLKTRLSKALAFAALSFFAAQNCQAQVCSSPSTIIYGLSSTGGIAPITVSSASVGSNVNSTAYSVATTHANGIGYNSINGKFYYFQNNTAATQIFMSFDPSTNVYTVLANSPIVGWVNSGCVNFNGTGYYCIDVNSNLCYYDIAHNTWTLITSAFTDQYSNNVTSVFTAESSGDMAIDGVGNLWIASSSTTQWALYKLSATLPTSSVASLTLKQLIAPNATPGGANFAGIAFSPSGQIYMSTNNDLYLLQNNYTLSHIGTFSVAGAGGDLTSCNFPYGILPVSWEGFTATLQSNNDVALAWQVSAQIDNKGYYVEHSTDGSTWDELGFVQSAGTSKNSENYIYTDINPVAGSNYYRIKQVDMDGNASYSQIKMIALTGKNSQLSIWPNPAKDVVNVKYDGNGNDARAMIFDQMGRMISSSVLHSGNNSVNVSNLSTGNYIVHVQSADATVCNGKLIKK